jgi:hypothetical protein
MHAFCSVLPNYVYCALLGYLGRCPTNNTNPICVPLPKVGKISIVLLLTHVFAPYHQILCTVLSVTLANAPQIQQILFVYPTQGGLDCRQKLFALCNLILCTVFSLVTLANAQQIKQILFVSHCPRWARLQTEAFCPYHQILCTVFSLFTLADAPQIYKILFVYHCPRWPGLQTKAFCPVPPNSVYCLFLGYLGRCTTNITNPICVPPPKVD